MGIPLKINNTFLGSRRQIMGIGPRIDLSDFVVDEDVIVGTTVGTLSVVDGSGVYTFQVTSDPDGKFTIDGDELVTLSSLDYETSPSHEITIEADNGIDSPIVADFTITVVDTADGAIVLLDDEATGLAADFAHTSPGQRVAVKAPAVTEYAVDDFFSNSSTSPKLITNILGLLEWVPHNQFVNSEVPVTQNVTLIVGMTYTFGVSGPGSLAGTNGASGTATEGNPVTFVATTTTGAFTKTGTLTSIQINRGSSLTAHVITAAAIKVALALDYHPSSHAALGLLTEPAATNVALWSRDMTNAAWSKTNITPTKDQVGVDGVANAASKLVATGANGTCLQSITLASSVRKQSAYVKRITGIGVVEMTTDNGSTWTAIVVPVGSYGRVSIPSQTLANPTVGFRIVTSGDAIAVDFVQNEVGTVVTSPIPTFGVSVTRATDNVTALTSTFPFAQPFSVIVNGAPRNIASGGGTFLGLSDGTTNERYAIDHSSGSRLGRLLVQDGGVTQADIGIIAVPVADQFYKIGVGIEENNFAVVVDGSSPATDVSGTLPTVDRIFVGGAQGVGGGNAHIRSFYLVPRRMTNSELQTKTTPSVLLFDKTKVVVTQTPGNIYIYTPGDNPETSRYIRHQFQQYIGAAGGGNGWNWERIHEVTRTGNTSFAINHNITDAGLHWPATKLTGDGVFSGGDTHGYEIDQSFVLEIDGSPVTIDGSTAYVCDSAEVIKTSKIYDRSDPVATNDILDLVVSNLHSADEVIVDIEITALANLSFETIYTNMLSFSLYLDYPSTAEINIDEVYSSPTFVEGVVGTEGSPLTSERYLMIGSTSGIEADYEMIAGWANAERDSFLQIAAISRKIYFAPLGINRTVSPILLNTNDVLAATGRLKITTHN